MLDSEGKMHADNIHAVESLRKRGIKFSIATGRMMTAALSPLKGLEIDFPMITLNGCYVGHPELFHKPIPNEIIYRVLPIIDGIDATIVAMKKDNAFMAGHEHIENKALENWVSNIEYVPKIKKQHLSSTTEFLITGPKDAIDNFHNSCKEILGEDADIFTFPSLRYKPLWYSEIRAKNVNKGESLQVFREHLGLKKDEVFIVGDYLNDIELFEEAGFSAAPSNALEIVKEKADYISPKSNDELAIVEIIDRFFT